MTIAEKFLAELQQEAATTRKILERVPFDKPDWKPHEKSMPLVHLATHVAEIPFWLETTVTTDELDFAKSDYKIEDAKSNDELLSKFDMSVKRAEDALKGCSDSDMKKGWTLKNGDTVYFTLCKEEVIRGMSLNHLIHHRAQLGVYLRLLDIPLPGVYGPTADDKMGM